MGDLVRFLGGDRSAFASSTYCTLAMCLRGLNAKEAAKQAAKEGKKAAKLGSRQARGSGTLCGTYAMGFLGEQRLGRFGYLIESQLGSWIGGRIGLIVYDVVNGSEKSDNYESRNGEYESPEVVYESPPEFYKSHEL